MSSAPAKDTNSALVGIRLGASNIVVAYFKVIFLRLFSPMYFTWNSSRMDEVKPLSMN